MFRDLMTGLDGTPMPSFVSNTTADQRWDLVHYVRTLSNTKAHLATNNDGKGQ
jgi:mono/diheme cytochrome c family protein